MANRQQTIMGVIAGIIVVAGGGWLVFSHRHAAPATGPISKVHTVSTPKSSTGGPTSAPLMMPVSGKLMSSFGWQYSGALNEWYYNPGITIAAQANQPVRAAWSGTVTQVTQEPHMGLTVTVADGDGFETVYGHLGKATVKAGDQVQQGQAIGTVGGSSLYSRQAGPHLDFQVYHGATATNPMNYLHPSS